MRYRVLEKTVGGRTDKVTDRMFKERQKIIFVFMLKGLTDSFVFNDSTSYIQCYFFLEMAAMEKGNGQFVDVVYTMGIED